MMTREETVRGIMGIFGPNNAGECQKLALRFRKALMEANPGMRENSMAIYDQAFGAELESLANAVREAQSEAAANLLTDEQIEVWRSVLESPNIPDFVASLRTLSPDFFKAMQTTFSTQGVAIHSRSADRLFANLAASTHTPEPTMETTAAETPES